MAKPTPVRGLHAATPMPEAARALLGGRLADVQRQLGKLRGELAADKVHDARVATRRLRAALVLFGDDKRVRRADKVVSVLQDALGEVRDLHVQLDAFTAMGDQASPLERTALRHVREHLASRLPGRTEALRAAIPKWQKDGLEALGRLERLQPRGKLGGHRTRDRLVGELEELEARVIEAQGDPSPTPMHELRKGVKKLPLRSGAPRAGDAGGGRSRSWGRSSRSRSRWGSCTTPTSASSWWTTTETRAPRGPTPFSAVSGAIATARRRTCCARSSPGRRRRSPSGPRCC